jgi:hypothetical protein
MLALPNPNRSVVVKAIGFAVLETTSRDATMQAGSGSGGAMCDIGVTRRPIAEKERISAIVQLVRVMKPPDIARADCAN